MREWLTTVMKHAITVGITYVNVSASVIVSDNAHKIPKLFSSLTSKIIICHTIRNYYIVFEFPSLNFPPNWPKVIVGMQWECVSGSVQVLGARSRSPARGAMCPGAWVRLGSSVPRQELRQWQALDRTRWCLSFYFCFLYLLLFLNLFIHSFNSCNIVCTPSLQGFCIKISLMYSIQLYLFISCI